MPRLETDAPDSDAPTSIPTNITKVFDTLDELRAQVSATLLDRSGSQQSGDWINLRCLYGKTHHRNGDRHPSAGFNTETGYYHCKNPNCPANERTHNTKDIGALLGFGLKTSKWGQSKDNYSPYREHMKHVPIGRLLDSIAMSNNAQETWNRAQLVETGAAVGLSPNRVDKAIQQALSNGYFTRTGRGNYSLTEKSLAYISTISAKLDGKPTLPLPPEAYQDSAKNYRREVLKTVEEAENTAGLTADALPSTRQLAQYAGLSPRSIYRHEHDLNIKKYDVIVRTPAPTTEAELRQLIDSGGLWWFQVINEQNKTLKPFYHISRKNSDEAEDRILEAHYAAHKFARCDKNLRVIVARRFTSVRQLPNQSVNVPKDAYPIKDKDGQIHHFQVDRFENF